MTGYSGGPGGNADLDYATVAYDAATGAARWVRRYDGGIQGTDQATGIAVSPDGSRVFVTGGSETTGSRDYATLAYDAATGATRWVRRYSGPANESAAAAVAVSPDGTAVFVTGSSGGALPSTAGYATVAYDAATGSTRWVRRYDGPASDNEAFSLAVSPDGAAVFVTGRSDSSRGYRDFATVAYDAATGAERWVRRFNDRDDEADDARAVGVSPDGTTVFVTGISDFDLFTIAYAADTGATRWHTRSRGNCPCADTAYSLAVSPDGGTVFVAGESTHDSDFHGPFDYATVAYDADTGGKLWHRRYDGPGNGSDDRARSVAVSPDGTTVYVTGSSTRGASTVDYLTVAYDAATGVTRWHRRYDGTGHSDDWARSVAVSPDGATVFVDRTERWPRGRRLRHRGLRGLSRPGGSSGGTGIRTLEGLAPLTVFKTVAFVRSAIPPAASVSAAVAAPEDRYAEGSGADHSAPLPFMSGQPRQWTSVTEPASMRTRPVGTGAPVQTWYSPSARPSITAAYSDVPPGPAFVHFGVHSPVR